MCWRFVRKFIVFLKRRAYLDIQIFLSDSQGKIILNIKALTNMTSPEQAIVTDFNVAVFVANQ